MESLSSGLKTSTWGEWPKVTQDTTAVAEELWENVNFSF